MATFAISQHCVPQLYLNGLFSSSLCTLCTLSLQPLQALCTSAPPERAVLQFSVDSVYSILLQPCSPVLCVLCVLYIAKVITALCTSAPPEGAVLQFSVDSVDSILLQPCSPVLCVLCVLDLYCKGYHSTVYLSCMPHLNGLFSSSLWTLWTLYCKGYHRSVDSVYYLSCT